MVDIVWRYLGLILGVVGGLLSWLGMWWQRRRRQALEETVARQEAALRVYTKKEEIRQHDQRQDQSVCERVHQVEQAAGEAKDERQRAEVVARALDEFFGAPSAPVRPDRDDPEDRRPADH